MGKRKRKRAADEPVFLFLAPYRHHLEVLTYPEARIVMANCGHRCWLSPQGEDIARTAYTVCIECGQDAMDNDHEGERFAVPGALAYLTRHHGHDAVDYALDLAQKYGVKLQG